jgi:hypothetical protein
VQLGWGPYNDVFDSGDWETVGQCKTEKIKNCKSNRLPVFG